MSNVVREGEDIRIEDVILAFPVLIEPSSVVKDHPGAGTNYRATFLMPHYDNDTMRHRQMVGLHNACVDLLADRAATDRWPIRHLPEDNPSRGPGFDPKKFKLYFRAHTPSTEKPALYDKYIRVDGKGFMVLSPDDAKARLHAGRPVNVTVRPRLYEVPGPDGLRRGISFKLVAVQDAG